MHTYRGVNKRLAFAFCESNSTQLPIYFVTDLQKFSIKCELIFFSILLPWRSKIKTDILMVATKLQQTADCFAISVQLCHSIGLVRVSHYVKSKLA